MTGSNNIDSLAYHHIWSAIKNLPATGLNLGPWTGVTEAVSASDLDTCQWVGIDNGARLLRLRPWFWDWRRRPIYFAICWQNAAHLLPTVGFGKILVLTFVVKGDCSSMCEVFAGQPKENYEPITRNLRLNGQSTSIRLERSFWDIIDSMASAEGVSTPSFLSTLQSEVIEIHGEAKNFTSLLRCACIKKIQLSMNDQNQSVLAQWICANFKPTILAAHNNNQV